MLVRCGLATAALLALSATLGCAGSSAVTTATTAEEFAEPPSLILTGGIVHTLDPSRPRAEAIAIRGDRIAAVGTLQEVRRAVNPAAAVIDLGGRTVTPGLVDGHCHLYGLGNASESLSLRGLKSPAEAAALVQKAAKDRPAGEWIEGRGWDQNTWSPPEFPSHAALDAVSNPVALRRVDGHALWVNAAAMRAAGVTRDTPDPPGGRILRRSTGEPSGVFIDRAMDLIEAKIPRDTPAIRERKILAAADAAVAAGITGVHEMGIDDDTVAVYRSLAKSGRLKLRVYALLSGEGQMESLPQRKPDRDPDGTAFFVLRAVKLFADGALGSRGAALLSPYVDEPASSGLILMGPDELRRAAELALKAGFQLGVHAIGDKANRMVLDAFEAAQKSAGARDARFRIEHAQIVAPEDIPRFKALGVLASMQPTHATSDMPWAPARLGPSRLAGAYAWRTLLDAGARVVFGSDFPVEDVSPLLGIYSAVTRQDPSGSPPGGWLPKERVSLDEALRLFTAEPAYASFTEAHRGQIAPGFVADLTVLDRALTPDRGLLEARADLTIVGGKIVFERVK